MISRFFIFSAVRYARERSSFVEKKKKNEISKSADIVKRIFGSSKKRV